MRSCLIVFLTLFGLSLVVWMGWEPGARYVDEFLIWWRGGRVQVEVEEDPFPNDSLPKHALPPPVFPARQTSALRTIRVTDAVDIPYQEVDEVLLFNEGLADYLASSYYDTEVIVRPDTIPGRDGLLFEVIDLERSRVRDFYMWNTFDLSMYNEVLPNSTMRVHLDLTGEYREQFMPDGWSAERSEQVRAEMRQVLQRDADHLLRSLGGKRSQRDGSFLRW